MNEKALFALSYGLYIISSEHDGQVAGCVANTLHQVTASPVQLSITLHKDNRTEQLIEASGKFNAVVLTKEISMETVGLFGFHSSVDTDKYGQVVHDLDSMGIPYLREHTASRFACKVVGKLDIGTHITFIGEVIEGEITGQEEVMTYSYYHKVKNGLTPPKASSYQEAEKKQGWRCTICGYIYEGDSLPEDYICPICGAPADVFEKM